MVELGKALLKSAEDGDTNEVKNLIGRGAPMTADWLGMLKRVSSVQILKINIYPLRDENCAYNRTVNDFLNQSTHSDTARCDSESID